MADQWLKGEPAGTQSASDIDALILANNAALDRLFANYRRGCYVRYTSAATVTIGVGELTLNNVDGSVRRLRQITSEIVLDITTDLDAGAEAVSTVYYVWGIADADATTFTGKISLSSSAPTGCTYYRLLGYFYNNSSGDIVNVSNKKEGDASNVVSASGSTDISTASATYVDMTDMVLYFVSSGRPVRVSFTAPVKSAGPTSFGQIAIDVDGVDKRIGYIFAYQSEENACIATLDTLAAGAHTIKIQWKASAGTVYQNGSTVGDRIVIAEEL